MKSTIAFFVGITSFFPVSLHAADGDLSAKFGFSGVEIYKVAFRSGNMLAGDFNHDGKLDLIVVDNSHSRIDLFQQRYRERSRRY